MTAQQHHHHEHRSLGEPGQSAMAELLDLDAEVLHDYLSELTGWVADLTDRPDPRILDLGSGTGTGTFALLQRFAESTAVAVDASAGLLEHLTERARHLGVADRVRTVQADLDAAWPALDTVDLVWASASLHHLADPDRVLREVFTVLRPGGLLVVAELDSFPHFLPADLGLGAPGLEERCHAALAPARTADLPNLGDDWGPRVSRAGFRVEAERRFAIELTPPLPAATARYAQASLRRVRSGLDGLVSREDLAVLDTILDGDGPEALLRRDDLTVRAARTVWVGRRL